MEKNKCKVKMIIKDARGITLLALAVTIVVLLILTSIGLKLALGNNDIIGEAKNAKELAEIDEEKGIVKRATTVSLIKSKGSKVEQDTLEKALDDETGEGKTEVSNAGDFFEVAFVDSNRYYEVDSEGNISDVNEIIKDNYVGDITKGGKCDGSKEKPYEISCIEDLVVLSNLVDATGIKLENGVPVNVTKIDNFDGKYIILTRNLNFKSKYSYDNYTRTDFGDLNEDDTDGNMLMNEMTTGTGFTSIGSNEKAFYGNFDGKGHTIANIYINSLEGDKKNRALFALIAGNASISNLTITGDIQTNWHTGGIVAEGSNGNNCIISNCINKANIIGYNMVGGIVGRTIATIENCKNYGTIEITGNEYGSSGTGGIIGQIGEEVEEIKVSKCENYGEIKGLNHIGGIVGCAGGEIQIIDCTNKGRVNSINNKSGVVSYNVGSGGIVGRQQRNTLKIINSNNMGEITDEYWYAGGIIGRVGGSNWDSTINCYIYNCYNLENVKSSNTAGGIVGCQGTVVAQNYLYIENSYNIGNVKANKIGSIIGVINYETRTDTKTEIKNTYYINEPIIGTGTLTTGEATLKSVSEIKSQTFVDLLNSNIGTNTDWKKWKLGNNGYPTFLD